MSKQKPIQTLRSIKEGLPLWMKRPLRYGIIMPYRRATSRKRALPNFIIIGAQKSGSTSLFNYMAQHPDIFPSFRKEIQFFDGGLNPNVDSYELGEGWYRSFFPFQNKLGAGQMTFEANPNYTFNPIAPKRIKELLPNVKLILVMRNPTERAISHYFHMKRKDFESESPLDAMKAEEERLKEVVKKKDYKSAIFRRYSYKLRGLYKQQILRYRNHFDENQILCVSSEELFQKPRTVLDKAFEFVGVDSSVQIDDLKPKNVGSNREKVGREVYDYLNDYFKPHNEELYELLGERFDW